MPDRAILLVNLGSPASPAVGDVRRYLREFLGDPRVIDYPAWLRWLLLEGIVLRVRPRRSARAYARIWTPAGSPLVVTTERVRAKLEAAAGLPVFAGMRYGAPSIAGALERLRDAGVRNVFLFPQYPHYAMSSWETVVEKVRSEAARLAPQLHFTTVPPSTPTPTTSRRSTPSPPRIWPPATTTCCSASTACRCATSGRPIPRTPTACARPAAAPPPTRPAPPATVPNVSAQPPPSPHGPAFPPAGTRQRSSRGWAANAGSALPPPPR
jgi:hypothetical protein